MFGKKRVDALVTGAGPCGMVAALVLAQNGIDTSIIDAASNCVSRSNAHVLHPATLALFDRLGFAQRVLNQGYRIDRLVIYDDTQPREIVRFDTLEGPFNFALAIPQCTLEAILADELEQAGCLIKWDHRLSEARKNHVGLDLVVDRYTDRQTGYAVAHSDHVIDRTLQIHAGLLVAADGYNSTARHLFRVEPRPQGPHEYYAFFDFETDKDPERTLRVSLKRGLVTAEIPMGHGRSRLSFQFTGMNLPNEYRQKERDPAVDPHNRLEMTDDTHFRELIESRVPWDIGRVNRVLWRAVAPFERQALANPHQDQAYFLGDAARTFGPLSAASINLGMQEAEQLALTLKQGVDLGGIEKRLEALALDQVRNWKQAEGIEHNSAPMYTTDAWTSRNRARILQSIPSSGEDLVTLARQIYLHVESSPLHAEA